MSGTRATRRFSACLFRFVCLIALLSVFLSSAQQPLMAQDNPDAPAKLYLPSVGYEPVGAAASSCGLNAQERAFADRMSNHRDQGRASMTCNAILARVARARAADMAAREYFSHVNPDGHGPNYLVRQAGYRLPDFYDQRPSGNNIESLGAGFSTAADAWNGLMNSSGHRAHLLGENDFYAEQVEYGIGYVSDPDSPYRHYWVIITAYQGN